MVSEVVGSCCWDWLPRALFVMLFMLLWRRRVCDAIGAWLIKSLIFRTRFKGVLLCFPAWFIFGVRTGAKGSICYVGVAAQCL